MTRFAWLSIVKMTSTGQARVGSIGVIAEVCEVEIMADRSANIQA